VRLGVQKGGLRARSTLSASADSLDLPFKTTDARTFHITMLRRPPSRKQKRAAYNRAHRARMKAGRRTALVEWDSATVDLLVKAQALTRRECEEYTRVEVGSAITRLLSASVQQAIRDGVIRLRRG
jgi:hypothetical protein